MRLALRDRSGWLAVAFSVLLGLGVLVPLPATSASGGPRSNDRNANNIDDRLEAKLAASANKDLRLIIRTTGATAEPLARVARVLGAGRAKQIQFTDYLSATAPGRSVAALAALAGVAMVEEDLQVDTVPIPNPDAAAATNDHGSSFTTTQANSRITSINQPIISSTMVGEADPNLVVAREQLGIDGDGDLRPYQYGIQDQVIAVIDSGIDDRHQAFANGKVLLHKDFTERSASCGPGPLTTGIWDELGHGTHVASIAAGRDGVATGVAPGAALIDLKVFDCIDAGQFSWVNSALGWVLENHDAWHIGVVNLSLGATVIADGTDSTSRLVNQLQASGVNVIVAAGNSGSGVGTIGIPGVAEFATTVGALNTGERGEWEIWFSSRGPTGDGRPGVDVLAPGVSIWGASSGSTEQHLNMSGTSMAAPFVAGLTALLRQTGASVIPAGTACAASDFSADCADGVMNSTMSDPAATAIAATSQDMYSAGVDPDSGAGAVRAANALAQLKGSAAYTYPSGRSVSASLSGAKKLLIPVNPANGPVGVSMLISPSPDKWTGDSPALTAFDVTGNEVVLTQASYGGFSNGGAGSAASWLDRQESWFIDSGASQVWIEVLAPESFAADVSLYISGSSLGTGSSAVHAEVDNAATEGGSAATISLVADQVLGRNYSFTVNSGTQLSAPTTVSIGPAAAGSRVSFSASALNDTTPEGRHYGLLLLSPGTDYAAPFLRVGVPIADNDAGTIAERRLLYHDVEFPQATTISNLVTNEAGSVFASIRGPRLTRFGGSAYPRPVLSKTGGDFQDVSFAADGGFLDCQVDVTGISADSNRVLAGIWQGCASQVDPTAPIKYLWAVRDIATNALTYVGPAASEVGANYRVGQAAITPDGSTVAYWATTTKGTGIFLRRVAEPSNQLLVAIGESQLLSSTNSRLLVATWDPAYLVSGEWYTIVMIDITTGAISRVATDALGATVPFSGSLNSNSDNLNYFVYSNGSNYLKKTWSTGAVSTIPARGDGRIEFARDVSSAGDTMEVCYQGYSLETNRDVCLVRSTSSLALTAYRRGAYPAYWKFNGDRSLGHAIPLDNFMVVNSLTVSYADTNGALDIVLGRPVSSTSTYPAAVTGLTASLTGSSISASWTAVAGAASYQIGYYSTEGWRIWKDVGNATSTTLSNTMMLPSASNLILVRAVNDVPGPAVSATAATPTNPAITSVEVADGSASVHWSASNAVTGYQLQQSMDGGAWTAVGSYGQTTYSATMAGLSNDHQYRFRVGGVASGGKLVSWSTASTAAVPRTGLTLAPAIADVSPLPYVTGNLLTVTGRNFHGLSSVQVNGISAVYSRVSSAELAVTVPAGLGVTPSVVITTTDGTATAAAPVVTLNPVDASVTVGSVVTFTSAVSGAPAPSVKWQVSSDGGANWVDVAGATSTSLTLTAAAGDDGKKYHAVFTSGWGSATTTDATLKIIVAAPKVTSFLPTSGAAGKAITITGENFSNATSVSFGTKVATRFEILSSTTIIVGVPSGSVTAKISVTTPSGTGLSATSFSVSKGSVAPTISQFTPTYGEVGTRITVTGNEIGSALSVSIGGVTAASFKVTAPNQLEAVVKAGAVNGSVSVTTAGGTVTTTSRFSLPPLISSFPASAVAGSSITINGSNFLGATAVTINGGSAITPSAVTNTSLQITVPANATSGYIQISTGYLTPATSASTLTVTQRTATAFSSWGPTSALKGKSMTLTATLTASGTPVPGVTVTITFNGKTYTLTTSTQGVVSVTVTAPAKTTVLTATATFAGNTTYAPASKSWSVSVA